ncbi:MAG TPA: hypothetical protein VHE30_27295 [Polyangiaceae bacterium]|nr:hypothetical protein [Polyangiaceae bacterium]
MGVEFAPGRALAQAPERLDLRWDAPSECPSEKQVRDRIGTLAGSARTAEASLRAEARVTRTGEGKLHLDLVVRAGDLVGRRSIDARSCADLAGATAVALALLLRSETPLGAGDLAGHDEAAAPSGSGASPGGTPARSEAAQGSRSAGRTEPASSEDAAEAKRPPEPTSHEGRGRRRTSRVVIQAPFGAATAGALPEPSLGLAVAGGLSFDRVRFFIDAALFRSQRLTASDDPDVGADARVFTVGPRACFTVVQGVFELAPCLSLTVERLRARGSGPHIAPRTAESTWLAPGVRAEARVHLAEWLALVVAAEGRVDASRPVVAVDGVGTLGRVGLASVTGLLGPEWIL